MLKDWTKFKKSLKFFFWQTQIRLVTCHQVKYAKGFWNVEANNEIEMNVVEMEPCSFGKYMKQNF